MKQELKHNDAATVTTEKQIENRQQNKFHKGVPLYVVFIYNINKPQPITKMIFERT